jgi:hypothetical protein
MLPSRDIYRNQTDILRWLESRGHRVAYEGRPRSEGRRVRGCSLKVRHETMEAARQVAGAGMTVYRCEFCHGFHAASPR